MWIFRAMLGRMILRCCWRGFSSALLGARLSERTRAGRVPASYPTASTRRLMSPIADARTDHKVYADCHRDCRNNDYNINKQDDRGKRGKFPPVFSPGFPASSSWGVKRRRIQSHIAQPGLPPPPFSALSPSKWPKGSALKNLDSPLKSFCNKFVLIHFIQPSLNHKNLFIFIQKKVVYDYYSPQKSPYCKKKISFLKKIQFQQIPAPTIKMMK